MKKKNPSNMLEAHLRRLVYNKEVQEINIFRLSIQMVSLMQLH